MSKSTLGVPAGGDLYVHRAMRADRRLLFVEMVLPPGDSPHQGKMLDIFMLALHGGRERSEPEYRVLLEKTGLRIARLAPRELKVTIIEALPAE
jgi:hypothetical protein